MGKLAHNKDFRESNRAFLNALNHAAGVITAHNRLLDDSFRLKSIANEKTGEETSLISIIFEEHWPPHPKDKNWGGTSARVFRFQYPEDGKVRIFLDFSSSTIPLPTTAIEETSKTQGRSIVVESADDSLYDFFAALLQQAVDDYETPTNDAFGCCSKWEKCSDEKMCLHHNLLYAKRCMYRKHLEAGRIFYGKNRNVD